MSPARGSDFSVGPDEEPDKYRLLRSVGGGGEAELWEAAALGRAGRTPGDVIIGPRGQAVLVDFGLVRVARQESPTIEGTRGYRAPEVRERGLFSPASDRYAFGALAYFVLSGQHPPEDARELADAFVRLPLAAAPAACSCGAGSAPLCA